MLGQLVKCVCIFLITFAIFGCNNQGFKEEAEEALIQQDIEEIKWYDSFEDGLEIAKKERKPLMVDFEAEWCIWCKRLDETTYKDQQIITLSKKFIPVKVNCDKDIDTARRYGVRGLPTIIFMNSEGEIIHQIVGYRGPKEFAIEMKKVIGD
jgi:thiol:disulfide interchange protein